MININYFKRRQGFLLKGQRLIITKTSFSQISYRRQNFYTNYSCLCDKTYAEISASISFRCEQSNDK